MIENDWTKVLGWPGYKVYRAEIDDRGNLTAQKKRQLNALLALNRRVTKAYLLKESLDRLWSYRYEGAMLRYLKSWIDQLRWQRL